MSIINTIAQEAATSYVSDTRWAVAFDDLEENTLVPLRAVRGVIDDRLWVEIPGTDQAGISHVGLQVARHMTSMVDALYREQYGNDYDAPTDPAPEAHSWA